MTVYQWLLLSKILKQNNSLKDGFELLHQMIPIKRIEMIQQEILEGKTIEKILTENPFEKQIGFYSQYTSLQQAIEIAYYSEKQKKKVAKEISQRLSYSLLLLIASMAVLFLFTDIVLPQMLQSLSLQDGQSSVVIGFQIINFIKNILLAVIVVTILLFSFIVVGKKETIVWAFLHQKKRDKILKIIATYQLVVNLAILLEENCSLIDALEILRFDKKRPLAAMLASHFHNSLLEGNEFEDSLDNEYFDEGFHTICLWGLKDDNFLVSLKDYKEIIEERMMEVIKRFAAGIQVICYLFVIIIIVLAYRVLMLPLEMLNEF